MNIKSFCKNRRLNWAAIVIGVIVATASGTKSEAAEFNGINITVEGSGPSVIFIPGLNSSKETFTGTCEALKSTHTCHLLHLPGFAGNAPLPNAKDGFLPKMRDSIEQYIREKRIDKPVLVGHSLGGFLSLQIAEHAPELVKAVVIVDSLPFYSAIQDPAATEASVKPRAEMMRQQMLSQPLEQYKQSSEQVAKFGMTRLPERVATVAQWNLSSDRATTSQAMYEIMTMDMRDRIANIKAPTLVLGSWAAYAAYGSTKESTRAIFAAQYQKLAGVKIEMSETGFHFLSWDDAPWVNEQIATFLQSAPTLASRQ